MLLAEYLNAGIEGTPSKDVKGIPSEAWMPVTKITVSHGVLWAGDPYICDGEDGCSVETPKGEYVVEARGFDFNGVRVIGRVRARLSSAAGVVLGEETGHSKNESGVDILSKCMIISYRRFIMQFTALIEREGNGYTALCPGLDIASQGDTVEEARDNLKEALELFFECASPEEVKQRLHGEIFVTQVEVAVA